MVKHLSKSEKCDIIHTDTIQEKICLYKTIQINKVELWVTIKFLKAVRIFAAER